VEERKKKATEADLEQKKQTIEKLGVDIEEKKKHAE